MKMPKQSKFISHTYIFILSEGKKMSEDQKFMDGPYQLIQGREDEVLVKKYCPWIRVSDPDPDPHVFALPGSGSA